MSKAITKDYLLTQLKNFDSEILQNEFIEKVTSLPTASADIVGKIVQYVGTSSSTVINGYFYICESDGASGYKWSQKNVQPQVDISSVIDDSTSSTTTTYSSDKIDEELNTKVDIDQGVANAGKILKVNEEGSLELYDGSDYEIKKQTTAESGFIATYQLFHGDTAVGDKINIPKDYLVKSVELKTVTVSDAPVTGYVIGDKYIDFVINTVDADGTASHLYLLVKDLVDVYTGGNGIDISDSNVVSVKLASNKGLEFVGTNSDELAVKVQSSDDVTLSIDASGIKATLVYETDNIDFSTEW